MQSILDVAQLSGRNLQQQDTGDQWLDSHWYQQLQPGSWRGVGFMMDAAEARAGRRTVLHEYPYRDTVWVEDLGRLPRRFAFQAFLVGDDCYQRRDRMVQACETAGEGTLVHPTFGSVQCICVEFATTDRRERGRLVEIAFTFVVSGDIQFPATAVATQQNVANMASGLRTASAGNLASSLSQVRLLPQASTSQLGGFTSLATNAVTDPTRALSAVTGLQGFFGRYATGRREVMLPATATVQSQLQGSITSQNNVLAAASRLLTAGASL